MRIISGKYKSRKIYTSSPAKEDCTRGNISGFRPTTDRAKETLFNVLNNIADFTGMNCLDLFAGSGALGFEAISRGAESCDFVENSRKQIDCINKTAAELDFNGYTVYNEDVIRFLKLNTGEQYDIIFADPPYAYEFYEELVSEVMQMKFSIFVLEHGLHSKFMYNISDYDVIDKIIGAVNFKIFINKKEI